MAPLSTSGGVVVGRCCGDAFDWCTRLLFNQNISRLGLNLQMYGLFFCYGGYLP